jgi:4-amino-4-deoxy-L-arabinose transferase-like glycosyltransferase
LRRRAFPQEPFEVEKVPRVYNDSQHSQRLPGHWLAGLFLLALGLRTLTLVLIQSDAYLSSPKADSLYFIEWARSIQERSFWGKNLFVQSPLYPYLMSAAFRLFSDPLLAVRVAQVLLGSFTVLGVALAAQALASDRRSALLAGLVAAAYGPFSYYSCLILKEALAIFLITAFFLLVLVASARQSLRLWGLGGIVLGLFWLVRANAPFLALPVLVGLGLQRRFVQGLWFGVGLVLPVLPLTVRNILVAGQFAFTLASGGSNFYVGNNPDASGLYYVLPGVSRDPRFEASDLVQVAERMAGRPLSDAEASDVFVRSALHFIVSQPLKWLQLMLRKTLLFWNAFEIPDNYDYNFFRDRIPLLGLLLQFPFVAAFGLAGLALPAPSREVRLLRWEVLLYMLSVILFYVNDRFRVVFVPLLIVGCALAFRALLRRSFLLPLALAAGFFALTQTSVCDAERARVTAFSWSRYGDHLLEQRRTGEAQEAFARAYAVHKDDPYAARGLGVVAMETHDFGAAAFYSMEALRLGAEDPELYQRIVTALIASGQRDKALEFLRLAIRVEPDKPQPRELLRALGESVEQGQEAGHETP